METGYLKTKQQLVSVLFFEHYAQFQTKIKQMFLNGVFFLKT